MITVYKVKRISAAHQLNLAYESKCNKVHGHNYKIEVWIRGEIQENGMVVDFDKISKVIMKMDHVLLNDIFDFETTVENISLYLFNKFNDYSEKLTPKIKDIGVGYAVYSIPNEGTPSSALSVFTSGSNPE